MGERARRFFDPAKSGRARLGRLVALFLALLLAALAFPRPAYADTWQPAFPIRAAFYYPWFPEAWNQQGMNPFTHYHPSLGFYDSSSSVVIRQHLAAMRYANIQVGISSWWGQGSRTDQRVPLLLGNTAGLPFRWSLYYELEGVGDPSVAQISSDLSYIKSHYGGDPSFLRLNGQFVVFVYAQPTDGCGMADRWKQGNTVGAYIVLKVFPGYASCASQPQAWHQYSPAAAEDSQAGRSFAISPGFYKGTEASPRLARDLTRWSANVRDMVNSHAPFQLVTTFSEWGEGTSVESASEWASPSGYGAYLDALHTNGLGVTPTPTPAPTPSPTPTPAPTGTATPVPTATGSPAASASASPVASGTSSPAPGHSASSHPSAVAQGSGAPSNTNTQGKISGGNGSGPNAGTGSTGPGDPVGGGGLSLPSNSLAVGLTVLLLLLALSVVRRLYALPRRRKDRSA